MRSADIAIFKFRFSFLKSILRWFRIFHYRIMGMYIGHHVLIDKIYTNWPFQVHIGSNSTIEHNVFFKYDGPWRPGPSIIIGENTFIGNHCEFNISKSVKIGNDCLIASGCKFIDHNHGKDANELICRQQPEEQEIVIGNDVWLGVNVVVLNGITIGSGAVIAAGAIVNKDIPPKEIWGGVPAKKIGERK